MLENKQSFGGSRAVERALVIADNPWFRRALRRAVQEVLGCSVDLSSRRRWPQVKSFDLVIFDVGLLDETSFRLVERIIAKRPRPLLVVVASNAPGRAAFQLGSMGVEAFLQKPFSLSEFKAELTSARTRPPSLELLGRSWVGRVVLRAAQTQVRRAMLDQALDITNGNLTHAARILSVSRQALQRSAREAKELVDFADSDEGAR